MILAKSNIKNQISKTDKLIFSDHAYGVKGGLKTSSKLGDTAARTMAELMAGVGKNVTSLQKGQIIDGTVKKITPQEILLDIGYKSDALVIEYDKNNLENLLKYLKAGDKVQASVISCESEEGYPVVSLRRMLDGLVYSELEDKYKKGEAVEVDVLDETRGGFFVATAKGIKGFLPTSQALDEKDLMGRKINVKIIELDRKSKRVVFSQKANVYMTDSKQIDQYLKRDHVVEAEVVSVSPYGIYVIVTPKEGVIIEGFVHISEVSHQRIENLQGLYDKGQKIKAQIIEVERDSRRVNMSIKRLEKDAFEEVKNKYQKDQKIKGRVSAVATRGIKLEIEPGIFGFIPTSKIPSQTTYNIGETVDVEVSDFDMKHHLILVTPVLKEKPMMYR